MKKKTKKKPRKVAYKGPTLMDRIPRNRGEWLLLCIKFTERVITNPPRESDKHMQDQSSRLQDQLAEWKLSNPNEPLRFL